METAIGLNKPRKSKFAKIISWSMVFIFCNLAWVFFRADSVSEALFIIYHVFADLADLDSYLHTRIGLDMRSLQYIGIVILIVAIYDAVSLKRDVIKEIQDKNVVIRLTIEYAIVVCIGYALVNYSIGSNQFVYFQF